MTGLRRLAAILGLGVTAACAAEARDVVLVAGATGGTGAEIVRQLVAAGTYDVRALVRDAARAKKVLPAVALVVGDVRDPATLQAPLRGVQYVISAIGATGAGEGTANGPLDVDFKGVKNLADVAGKAGVRHFVLVSSQGASRADSYPVLPLRPFLAAKALGEAALRASGVPYTIVRPAELTNEAGTGSVAFSQGDGPGGAPVTRADVAAVCIAVLGEPAALGKTFEIGGGPGGGLPPWQDELSNLAADPAQAAGTPGR